MEKDVVSWIAHCLNQFSVLNKRSLIFVVVFVTFSNCKMIYVESEVPLNSCFL